MKLSRRTFLQAGAAAAATLAQRNARAVGGRKPNLLVLLTDEQRLDTIDVYGNRGIQAPNLSRLAGESVVFRDPYVSQPVCTPARATIMTGLWPHQHGCTQNNIALPETVPALPRLIADPDYRTGYFGKWHLGDEVHAQRGFQEWRSMEDGYSRFFREGRDTARTTDYGAWLQGLGYTPDTERGDFSRSYAANLPIEHCKAKYLELEACDFMRRHRDTPFLLYVSFLEPHMPFTGPLNALHKPEDVELPINFDDPLEENEPLAYRMRAQRYLEGLYANEFDLSQEREWRRLIAHYWGLVSQLDQSVGAILETLEELGLAEDTLVVFTSEHGDMMGSHRLIEKGVMYQEAMRIPWLMRVPAFGRKQRFVEGPVSQIDLVPTLLDLMGAETHDELPGKSLAPAMRGEAQERGPVFVQWNAPEALQEGRNPAGSLRDPGQTAGSSSRAVITPEGWKLVLHDKDLHQLYHLAEDPGETTNLFGREEHAETAQHLAGLIRKWQNDVKDPLALPVI